MLILLNILKMIYFRTHDFVGAFKQAIKINDPAVLVDLLGAVLEKK